MLSSPRASAVCLLAAVVLLATPTTSCVLAQTPAPAPETEERLRRLEEVVRRLEGELARERANTESSRPGADKGEAPSGEGGDKKKEEEKKKAEEGYFVGSDPSLKARWRDGLGFYVDSPNDDYHLHFGGRFDLDAAWFGAGRDVQTGRGGVGPLEDGADFRRVRLRIDGQVYEIFDFVFEVDVAQGIEGATSLAGPTDVYGDVTHLPLVGNVRVGHFREPFSMDALTSGNALTFLERSNVWEAFVPFRNLGVMLFDTVLDDRASWAVGAFRSNNRTTGNAFDYGDGEYALTGRVTALPWYEQDGRCLVHVGAAFSHRGYSLDPGQDAVRYRVFPETRVGRYVFGDTGNLRAESATLLGAEFAFQWGAFAFQSEYTRARVNDALIGGRFRDPSFSGWYVQGSYFLTGENKTYRRRIGQRTVGVFDRPRPHENFFLVRAGEGRLTPRDVLLGRGAWEIAVRYTHIDLNAPGQGVAAQVVRDVTFGLNWYLNANVKVQGNYVFADRDYPAQGNRGTAHVLALRFHYDF